jgi:hypothetical protein
MSVLRSHFLFLQLISAHADLDARVRAVMEGIRGKDRRFARARFLLSPRAPKNRFMDFEIEENGLEWSHTGQLTWKNSCHFRLGNWKFYNKGEK